jgi:hypothetical protein
MLTNIYVLKLENNKWYVGNQKIFESHLSGDGSAWTKKYKPIEIFKIFENVSPFLEDAYTKEYMNEYGIDHVRGGSYVTIELSLIQKESIQKELWSMKNLCNNCGSSDHWAKDCKKTENKKISICSKCGRNTHTVEKCFAKTHLKGSKLRNEINISHMVLFENIIDVPEVIVPYVPYVPSLWCRIKKFFFRN